MLMPVGSRLVVSRDSFWRSTRNDSGLCHISEELHLSQLSSPSGCPPADADLPMCNGSSIADRELREGDMQCLKVFCCTPEYLLVCVRVDR
eukprot:2285455-Pyramimonas_sp.AAC.1